MSRATNRRALESHFKGMETHRKALIKKCRKVLKEDRFKGWDLYGWESNSGDLGICFDPLTRNEEIMFEGTTLECWIFIQGMAAILTVKG